MKEECFILAEGFIIVQQHISVGVFIKFKMHDFGLVGICYNNAWLKRLQSQQYKAVFSCYWLLTR